MLFRSGLLLKMKAMKTTSLKHSTALLLAGLSLATAAGLLPITGRAQGAWEANEVKGKSTVYRCKKNLEYIYIYNSKYPENLQDERAQYNPEVQEFSRVRLVSHDAVLNAFRRPSQPRRSGSWPSWEKMYHSASMSAKGDRY